MKPDFLVILSFMPMDASVHACWQATHLHRPVSRVQLETIQSRLLDVGSAVATPAEASGLGSAAKKKRVEFDETAAPALESWIDEMDEELPQLTNFILPSGVLHTVFKVPLHASDVQSACRQQDLGLAKIASTVIKYGRLLVSDHICISLL